MKEDEVNWYINDAAMLFMFIIYTIAIFLAGNLCAVLFMVWINRQWKEEDEYKIISEEEIEVDI